MKILIPVDDSSCTRKMLAYLASHEELLGRQHEYVALHVLTPLPGYALQYTESPGFDAYYRDKAEQALQPAREFAANKGWNIRTDFVIGHAGESIAQYARDCRSDLIVMGSHGRNGFGSWWHDSVCADVLARATQPLMMVH